MAALEQIVAKLSGGASEREAAYTELLEMVGGCQPRQTHQVSEEVGRVAASSASALCAVLCRSVEEVSAAEFQRAAQVLVALRDMDRVLVHAEREPIGVELGKAEQPGLISVWRAQESALGVLTASENDPASITADDVLTMICGGGAMFLIHCCHCAKVFQPAWLSECMADMMHANWMLVTGHRASEQRNLAVCPLAMKLLNTPGRLPDCLLDCCHVMLAMMIAGRPAVAKLLLTDELGFFEHLISRLETYPTPLEWINIDNVCRPGSCGHVMHVMKDLVESAQAGGMDLTARLLDSGYINFVIEFLLCVDQIDSAKINAWPVVYSLWMLSQLSGVKLPEIEAKLAASLGPSLRFCLDHDIPVIASLGWTSKTFAAMLCANLFGREEADDTNNCNKFHFTQEDIDLVVDFTAGITLGSGASEPAKAKFGAIWSLSPNALRGFENICISDQNKALLLRNPSFVQVLIDGLFLEEDHMRLDADPEILQVVQRNFADCIEQVALFPAGCAQLQTNVALLAALEKLAVRGMTKKAQVSATQALMILQPQTRTVTQSMKHTAEQEDPHVMLSYNWNHQDVIKRINGSLQRRGYATWIDIEKMYGSTVESMSAAVEHAAVVCYGISKSYKESTNCRLEAQYAMQQKKEMIPLMMEENFMPKGWLGMLLGVRLYYCFYGTVLGSDDAFEAKIGQLCRELGDMGRTKATASIDSTTALPVPLEPMSPAPAPEMVAAPFRSSSTSFSPSMVRATPSITEQRPLITASDEPVDAMQVITLLLQQAQEDRQQLKQEMQDALTNQRAQIAAQFVAPQEAVTGFQLSALQARLDALHLAQLLNDEELYTLEDLVGDYLELSATVGSITLDMLQKLDGEGQTLAMVAKLRKIVGLSEGMPSDAAFARQVRRKIAKKGNEL